MKRLFILLALVCALFQTAAANGLTDSGLSHAEILGFPEWPVTITPYGGTLLLSDSPETVPADGIMYQDTVNGNVRLFFHHVNGTDADKKIVVLLENPMPEAMSVTVSQYGLDAGTDYLAVGKMAQSNYLQKNELYQIEIPGKGAAFLAPDLDRTIVKPGMLVNGIYDFHTDRPVTVKVMMLPPRSHAKLFAATAAVLPTDKERLRGTFPGMDRMVLPFKVYNPEEDGTVAITLADNRLDPYAVGTDATTGMPALNYGNYGVVYRMFFPADAGTVSYYLNPRGGSYAGAMGVKYRHVVEQPVPTPADRLFMGESTVASTALVGNFEGSQSLWLIFSPPGASNLPVKLVIKPNEQQSAKPAALNLSYIDYPAKNRYNKNT